MESPFCLLVRACMQHAGRARGEVGDETRSIAIEARRYKSITCTNKNAVSSLLFPPTVQPRLSELRAKQKVQVKVQISVRYRYAHAQSSAAQPLFATVNSGY